MPRLSVMRHAKSDWSNALPDHDRPLAPRGQRNAPEMAQWLVESDLCPERILTSSAKRTQETVAAVTEHCETDSDMVEVRTNLYLASGQTWLDAIRDFTAVSSPASLLICGHNPGLDDLVDYLSRSDAPDTADGKLMTTAAIAVFEVPAWDELSPQACTFIELIRPRELNL